MSDQTNMRPAKKRFKHFVIKIVLFVLGRGFQSASRVDPDIKKEIDRWFQDGLRIMLKIWPNGPYMTMEIKDNKITYRGAKLADADIIFYIKNVESAFMLFTAQIGTAAAFAEHRILAKGDLITVMAFVRCLNIIEGHLFPKIISKRILKRVPKMGLKKQLIRFYIYLVGIPFGL